MRTVSLLIAVAALAATLSLSGCGARGDEARANGMKGAAADTALLAAADVATATTSDLSAGVPVSGTLAPGWRARVNAPSEDVVQEVLVREGQRVTKGQVLARFRLAPVQTAAASADAALKLAASDFERQKNLLREGAVSPRDVDASEAAWRAAEAQAALARRHLEDATVRAPGAGTVTERAVQAGDRVGAGDPMFVIADTRELEFEATMPSEFVPQVKPGDAVALTVSGFPAGAIHGRVARVNATADEATRQVKVYVTVPNAKGALVGDLFASGNVVTQQAAGALAVPTAAVRREGAAVFAWTLGADGKLAKRTIATGLRDEARDLVVVTSGLAAGDRVLVGPVEGLKAGQAARIADGKER